MNAKDLEKLSTVSKKIPGGPLSLRSARLSQKGVPNTEQALKTTEPIPEVKEEGEDQKEGEAVVTPNAAQCTRCQTALTEDEITINQRFIDQALLQTEINLADVSEFPLCVKCHFE